ncbi:hypothetical protein ACFRR7_17685 [Streptomyces sp. NPDC056909]|uniref:hypothetical protein n=1 Tax=Streptomyces sp. NPDC056909 TaxID=3345963 RepID=UPI0036AA080B
MDPSVAAGWIGGLAGLSGAVVGAGVSVWATRISQREQAKQNREALEFQAAENRRVMEFQAGENREALEIQAQQIREGLEFQARQNREALEFQASQSREARDFQQRETRELGLSEVDAAATDSALSELAYIEAELTALHFLELMFSTDRLPWEDSAEEHLRLVQLALARIPNRAVVARVMVALDLCRQYRTVDSFQISWTLWVKSLTRDMIDVLSAHRRGETELPAEEPLIRNAQNRLDARLRAAQEELRRSRNS